MRAGEPNRPRASSHDSPDSPTQGWQWTRNVFLTGKDPASMMVKGGAEAKRSPSFLMKASIPILAAGRGPQALAAWYPSLNLARTGWLWLACMISAGIPCGHAESDLDPPELLAVELSTNRADTTSGPQTIEISARLRDRLAGFGPPGAANLQIGFRPAQAADQSLSANLALVESMLTPDGHEALFRGTLTVVPGTVTGRWQADYLGARDTVGNDLRIEWYWAGGGSQYRQPRPAFEVNGPEDRQVPQVAGLSFSTNRVDVQQPFAEVNVRIRLTDDFSGIADPQSPWLVRFERPGHPVEGSNLLPGSGRRESGDSRDGWYVFQVTFPSSLTPGTYRLAAIQPADNAGNRALITAGELEARGLPVAVVVEGGSGGVPDLLPPELVGLRFSTNAVDTTDAPQAITVDVSARDDRDDFVFGYCELLGPSGRHHARANLSPVGPSTPQAGQLQRLAGTAYFPRHCEAGLWAVTRLELQDEHNNTLTLSATDLAAAGLPASILVNTAPRLHLVQSDGWSWLWWRRVPGEFAVERSLGLSGWTEIPGEAAVIEDSAVVAVQGGGGQQFFRLRRR
ncbi:MAG: hypothetical protein ACKVYV_09380 [Limisphaerales bacterium]